MTDTEILDFLEAEIKREPILLHNTLDRLPKIGPRGLGLLGGQRTLREMIQEMADRRCCKASERGYR